MPRMTIGEFAQRSGLTAKALRLYDDLDLLAPAAIDPVNGYRLYDDHQLEIARRIAALRGIGMPLERIRAVCDAPDGLAAAEVESYWRQIEADVRSRRVRVHEIVTELRKGTKMMGQDQVLTLATSLEGQGARAEQQDGVLVGSRMWAVADGFHGGPGGRLAVAALDGAEATTAEAIDAAFTRASAAFDDLEDVGSTLTILGLHGSIATVGHIGDSRAWLLRDGVLRALTTDHTEVASLVEERVLTAEEARLHPRRAVLNRALGYGLPPEPDITGVTVQPADRFLLTTDGVHALFDHDRLRALFTGEAAVVAAAITAAVEEAGAPDNYAAVIVDVL